MLHLVSDPIRRGKIVPTTAMSRQPASATDRLRTMSRWMRALIAFGAVFVLAAPFALVLANDDAVQGYVSDFAAETLSGSAVSFPPSLRGWAMAEARRIEQENAGFV